MRHRVRSTSDFKTSGTISWGYNQQTAFLTPLATKRLHAYIAFFSTKFLYHSKLEHSHHHLNAWNKPQPSFYCFCFHTVRGDLLFTVFLFVDHAVNEINKVWCRYLIHRLSEYLAHWQIGPCSTSVPRLANFDPRRPHETPNFTSGQNIFCNTFQAALLTSHTANTPFNRLY